MKKIYGSLFKYTEKIKQNKISQKYIFSTRYYSNNYFLVVLPFIHLLNRWPVKKNMYLILKLSRINKIREYNMQLDHLDIKLVKYTIYCNL